MKKKKIVLLVIFMIIFAGIKIQSQKPGEVDLVKENFDIDIMDKYDGGNIVDFGTRVYSIKGGKDSNLKLKLTSFDKGEENKIFELAFQIWKKGKNLVLNFLQKRLMSM